MEILESISRHYINKKKRSAVLSLKEEIFFEKILAMNIPPSLVISAIDSAFYKYGRRLSLKAITQELKEILSQRGLNFNPESL